MLVEFPLLVAIGAMPLAAGIVPLILKAHGNAVVVKSPKVLDQAIVELFCPFAGEKGLYRLTSSEKFRAVAPTAVLGIGERNAFGIARIPGIFRHARLLRGGLSCEWRKWRTRHDDLCLAGAGSPQSIATPCEVDGDPPIGRSSFQIGLH